jgi:hypothetical protein
MCQGHPGATEKMVTRSPCIIAVERVILKRVHILRERRVTRIRVMLRATSTMRFIYGTADKYAAALPRARRMTLEND